MSDKSISDPERLVALIRSPSRVPGEFLFGRESAVCWLAELRDAPGWRSPIDAPRKGQFLGWNGCSYFIGSYTAVPRQHLYPNQDAESHFVSDDGRAQNLVAWAPLKPPHPSMCETRQ